MAERVKGRPLRIILFCAVLGLVAACYAALHYMSSVPGKPHHGPLPPLTSEEAALAQSIARHIATIAGSEHNLAHYDELEKVARYIEVTLASMGYSVGRQEFWVRGKPVRINTLEPGAMRAARPRSSNSHAFYAISTASPSSASVWCFSSTKNRPISEPRRWAASTMRARLKDPEAAVLLSRFRVYATARS